MVGMFKDTAITLKILFPTTPPRIEPPARMELTALSICTSLFLSLINDILAIARTVAADKTPMVGKSKSPKKSNTGLIMTPPPKPAIAPSVEASKPIIKYKMNISTSSQKQIPYYFKSLANKPSLSKYQYVIGYNQLVWGAAQKYKIGRLILNLVEKPISFVFFKYNEAYSDHAYDISWRESYTYDEKTIKEVI